MDDFQLKGIVEEKFVKWEYNSSSATEKNLIADENKAKTDQPKDDTKKTETDNQSNAMKEKHGKVSFLFFIFNFSLCRTYGYLQVKLFDY